MKKNAKSFIPFAAIATILLISYILQKVPKTYGSDDSLNVYQKFQAGQPIQYLVVGDSIGRGSGAENPNLTWFKQLENKMNDVNDIPLRGDYVVQSGSTAFEGLFKLSQRKKHDHKDLIFIVFGENDRKYMKVDDFIMTYEALIRKVKRLHPNAELFTITESSLKYEEFASAIELLSKHYRATNVDMRPIFQTSGYTEKQLTKDLIHPNGLGYQFYANAIYEQFLDNTKQEKPIASLPSKLHAGSKLDLSEVDNYEKMIGFRPRGDYFTSNEKGSLIEYNFKGSILGVKLLRSPDGGEVAVFIDGNEITSLNTWWPFARERYLFITNGLSPGSHTVRFEVTGRTMASDLTTLPYVRISSIITDDINHY
ncbi:SGNH/GDSL hydrolase family protein [Peribacillus butanolivorans]|uniref:SGNH/GDSL hydrolase family protein n=1 Tax=Peribacillus butanolivorans TaxID=421767 RepID=UPI00167F6B52|nr:SGNH/GDSL hydrolase family protein [Peribacillus butanolivorans]QNU04326.1 SGNH/GDSL hydrolase family protein [Peribacillus butanolivorans]